MEMNIAASIILVLAIAGIISLVVYKMRRNNNNLTIDEFLAIHYDNLVGALQDVVSLLLINIDNYTDKESYEKDIICTTIEKLEENCVAFGIDASLFKLVDKNKLSDMLYNILHNEEITVFTATVPKAVIESKPELYDESVLELYDEDFSDTDNGIESVKENNK